MYIVPVALIRSKIKTPSLEPISTSSYNLNFRDDRLEYTKFRDRIDSVQAHSVAASKGAYRDSWLVVLWRDLEHLHTADGINCDTRNVDRI